VGTLPQELRSLQLTGEPVMVQRKKKHLRPHSGESCTGTDVDTGGSSRTKRPLSPGGTPQDAQC